MPESGKRHVLPVHMPPGAAAMIARAASRRHKSRAAFMRDAAIEAAARVLAEPAVEEHGEECIEEHPATAAAAA